MDFWNLKKFQLSNQNSVSSKCLFLRIKSVQALRTISWSSTSVSVFLICIIEVHQEIVDLIKSVSIDKNETNAIHEWSDSYFDWSPAIALIIIHHYYWNFGINFESVRPYQIQ